MDLNTLCALQQKLKQPEAAYQSLDRSLKLLEHISEYYPNVSTYKEKLGASYNAMSELLRQRGEKAEALIFARKANALLDSLVTADPNNIDCALGLAQSHIMIGRLLKDDGQFAAALQSFGRAVDLYESQPKIDARNGLQLARSLALCIPLIGMIDGSKGRGDGPQEFSKADGRRRKIYGDRAIEALRSAANGGFVDALMLEANPDLDSLRARDDFRALIQETEEKRATEGKGHES
jgi:tetratricopeptide (TPR) repeat protein